MVSSTINAATCKCGGQRRSGQRDCAACHRAAAKRRYDRLVELDTRLWLIRAEGVWANDPFTRERFERFINTYEVLVVSTGTAPDYVGVPVGFLPDDEIVVAAVSSFARVHLKQLRNYGIKRRTKTRNPNPQPGHPTTPVSGVPSVH